MADIDRLPVFMQQDIINLLKRAEELGYAYNEVAAWQWWVLRQAVGEVTKSKEGDYITLEGYRFRKRAVGKLREGSADLSDVTQQDTL